MATTQISAHISEETKSRMETYAKRHGLKKGFLVEEALLYHLNALQEIPEDVMIPPRLLISPEVLAEVASRLVEEEEPTAGLTALFRE